MQKRFKFIRIAWLHVISMFVAISTIAVSSSAYADFAQGRRVFEAGQYAEAVRIWRQAAWVADDLRAQVTLGDLYADGDYVPRDPVEAYVWYYLSLVNPSSFGRTEAAYQGRLVTMKHVLRQIHEIAFPMSRRERIEAADRIIYILSTRGASGYFKLGELFQDTRKHGMCANAKPSEEFAHLWLYCELWESNPPNAAEAKSLANDFNVIPKNHVDSIAFFMLAERRGDSIANATIDSYAQLLSNELGNAAPEQVCQVPAKPAKWNFPLNCRGKSFYEAIITAATERADAWTPPFEVYPAGHSNEAVEEVEDLNALNRIEKLKVSAVQDALNFLGFYRGPIDNDYGPMTARAVKQYQASIGERVDGVLKPTQAVSLVKSVADAGQANAQNTLGTMYFQGIGLNRDYSRAKVWFERAAAQRHAYALMNLGIIYRDGLSVDADHIEAAIYFKRSLSELRRHPHGSGTAHKLVLNECAKLIGKASCD